MTNEEVLQEIEKAKASGATGLDLRGKGLTSLPSEIGQLTKLTALDLRDNQLTTLPPEIGQLTELTLLYLRGNRLAILPKEMFQLTNLTWLSLGNNQLTMLPPEIGKLSSLKYLYLTNNQITTLPPEMCSLNNLETLNLSGNPLVSPPQEIIQKGIEAINLYLINEEVLRRIENTRANGEMRLDLSNLGLTTLPQEIGQLTSLTALDLRNNQLTALPPETFHLIKLKWLHLNNNQFANLPPKICLLTELKYINLNDNFLTVLPPEICQLINLQGLNLLHNPLISPPPEIAEQGIKSIRKYFAALEKGQQPLNEVKVLLIGDGAAGKTSLVKKLRGEAFDEHEDTTHGISIRGWEPECAGKQIRVNIWDFGGQEIQHATHQFFLSKRSLYVLVLDGRKDERTEYWLRHVEAFGGDSPVLVVLNKIDNNASFDVNRPFLLEKYSGIRDFFRISCKTGKGLSEFKTALLEELAAVEMIGTVWPGTWFAVKRKLEEMDKPYISAAEYRTFCQEAQITDEESCETLVDFLHDLGVAVHFRDFILDAMHVLDPIWVTEAVYKIITAEKMAKSRGVLHLDALKEILKEQPAPRLDSLRILLRLRCAKRHCCPPETHPYIMGLMEKFELCYPVGKEAVLIPQLLSVSEPKFTFAQDGSLRFALHYPDFLPPSVFPRFMVKVHKDIKAETCWRTGVLLADKRSGSQAVVKADMEARRINIWVQGDTPREYLHYLRYLLTDINSSFEKLKIRELVPLSDTEDITADYATLLEYAKNDIDKYIPTGATKVYSVHELLGLVQPKDRNELANFIQKVGEKPDEKLSPVGLLNELIEPKITILGITFNLKGFFEKLLERQRQQRRQKK